MRFRNHHFPALKVLAATVLFFATSGFVLWQNAHLTVLWHLSYILENATRISLGQLPYRDFPFPYALLTFVVQAAIIRLCGRVILFHYMYAAIAAGVASLLTWRILARLLPSSRLPLAWIPRPPHGRPRHRQHLSAPFLRCRLHSLRALAVLAAAAPGYG